MGNWCCRSSTTSALPSSSSSSNKEEQKLHYNGDDDDPSFTYRKGTCALEYWEPIVLLGEGSISSIHLVRRRPERVDVPYKESADVMSNSCSAKSPCSFEKCATGNPVYALKSIHKSHVRNDRYLEEMRKEISTMSHLNHPNIVKVLEAYERKRHIYLVMEYCSGGDLREAEGTSESNAQKIVRSILSAVKYLHEHKVAHRDRECHNYLGWVNREHRR